MPITPLLCACTTCTQQSLSKQPTSSPCVVVKNLLLLILGSKCMTTQVLGTGWVWSKKLNHTHTCTMVRKPYCSVLGFISIVWLGPGLNFFFFNKFESKKTLEFKVSNNIFSKTNTPPRLLLIINISQDKIMISGFNLDIPRAKYSHV